MLLSLLPLYAEEMKLKLDHGARALLERLNAAGVDDVIDPARPNLGLTAMKPTSRTKKRR
jgi:hypothetical protein